MVKRLLFVGQIQTQFMVRDIWPKSGTIHPIHSTTRRLMYLMESIVLFSWIYWADRIHNFKIISRQRVIITDMLISILPLIGIMQAEFPMIIFHFFIEMYV